ncbi:MAG TPA: hypothetical protein VKU85_01085, partial [bacterium]|nr:hypothetical protein [bacterium]
MSVRVRAGRRPLPLAALPLLGLFLFLPAPSPAATVNVPGDAATIQAGVDLAAGGDQVVLADGVWTGPGNRDVLV